MYHSVPPLPQNLATDSVLGELRGWLSRYKQCHGHTDSNVSLCARKPSIIDKNV